ncbi:MAG TPA: hypothetical protein VG994_12375 [Steroidobacteraceae bacterium]|nr:hypothetical protein [Steroidobacteraceae bacterium]
MTSDVSQADAAAGCEAPAFSIEELEARFEMEAIAGPAGISPGEDWTCSCTFEF